MSSDLTSSAAPPSAAPPRPGGADVPVRPDAPGEPSHTPSPHRHPPAPGDAPLPPRAELMAPAGDWDCVRAAIENGADAVYFGLQSGFNARTRAANFREDELPGLLALLHRRGLKGYVALNTLAFPSELEDVERTVRHVAGAGVDAVLVQDLGVLQLIRAVCPALTVHASTQMTLTSAEGLRVVEQLGVRRVVLARELSLAEIRRIRPQTSLELEVFVHGALCVAYSGQCLTSESLGGRSANRGECAQACRLPYELVCDGRDVELGPVKYLLSPQDLAAYALIPELLAAGVTVFQDRRPAEEAGVRGQHHAALSPGDRRRPGRAAGGVHAAAGRGDGAVVLARLLARLAAGRRS